MCCLELTRWKRISVLRPSCTWAGMNQLPPLSVCCWTSHCVNSAGSSVPQPPRTVVLLCPKSLRLPTSPGGSQSISMPKCNTTLILSLTSKLFVAILIGSLQQKRAKNRASTGKHKGKPGLGWCDSFSCKDSTGGLVWSCD